MSIGQVLLMYMLIFHKIEDLGALTLKQLTVLLAPIYRDSLHVAWQQGRHP